MSATNRGGLSRHKNDFYETPPWAVDLALDALGIHADFRGYVIDPGSGTGAIAQRLAVRAPCADIRGVELDDELVKVAKSLRTSNIAFERHDWLTWASDGTPDLVIGNPPYGPKNAPNLAEQFIRKALEVAGKRGTVAMLLRSSYMLPKKRRALRLDCGLPDRYELEKRPSFNGSGTDATDYAWHVWSPKSSGKWRVLSLP